MTSLTGSPLASEIDEARTQGTLEVVRLARRRRPPVRATVLPGATQVAWVLAELEMGELFDVEAGR